MLKRNKANGFWRDGYMDSGAIEQLRDSEIDIVGLAETNINWANKWARAKWCCTIAKAWPGSRVFVSLISTDDSESVNLQGGGKSGC